MPLAERQEIFSRIEQSRAGRAMVAFFNFDRPSIPETPGLTTVFSSDTKEALFRVLKESDAATRGVDICLYTRGGDTNAVWPLVSIIREFDRQFEVLVPFRAHSSGTLLAMAANRIVMGPLSELSPIDPTTGNQFNPRNPANPEQRLGISVEDVSAYFDFVRSYLRLKSSETKDDLDASQRDSLEKMAEKLVAEVHPLALGNVYRVNQQIIKLAGELLGSNPRPGRNEQEIVRQFTSRFFSHLHMVNRDEARSILGDDHLVFAEDTLAAAMDLLLRRYEDDFHLRRAFVLAGHLGDRTSENVRFVGGAIESTARSYLCVTEGVVTQFSDIPPNVTVQLPAGQPMPLVPGLPRKYNFEVRTQGWVHNPEPRGVTV